MRAHRSSAAVVLSSPVEALIEALLDGHLRLLKGPAPSPAEIRSWRSSLPTLARDLTDAGLGKVEMLVEYQLPNTSKRADVVLAGRHPVTGADSFVVVELKQWSTAVPTDGDAGLVSVGGMATTQLHPILQVRGYSEYMRHHLGIFDGPGPELTGVAYLHNASESDVAGLRSVHPDRDGRLFTGDEKDAFIAFLRSRLADDNATGAGDRFLASPVRPSKRLMEVAAREIREQEQFVLLDEQQIAYRIVQDAVLRAKRADAKEIVIVSGGPGSGKSVIALSLLGDLYRRHISAYHATGSKSFTLTLRGASAKGAPIVRSLFKYFNQFMTAEKNDFEVLICDEAHRLRETSVNRYTPTPLRDTGRTQLEELIDAARVPVFLLDEHQVVKSGEMGSVAEITAYAEARGHKVHLVDLDGQFRNGGSRVYEDWVLALLGLRGDAPAPWPGDERFHLSVADSPAELEARLAARLAEGETARMTAGYCWRWSDPREGNVLVPDVVVGDWARPWNVKSDRAVGDAPPSSLWATQEGGFGQVGCVYTAQGFEYDWNGVILGPDIVVRDGVLTTVRARNADPEVGRKKAVSDLVADRLIRNTYKVLLTRAMRGTVLYAVDPETNAFLRGLVDGGGRVG
ncbi:ATP-binding protein [Actinorhabdospora filicis]|uniref:ATP-binding protein n=1 Tax=Actinorhabdospora filicis TaxID=1785913 RepID=A0A9W6SJV0_9ACTN|nr:DUF2075 domain-containing protein [Actinorhabdospora filicis]GLZ77132.1 ATP-binding protein [Actinorhabdospora filicis]